MDSEEFIRQYIPPDYTECPAFISISRTLIRNGLNGITLVAYPVFMVFYKNYDLLTGSNTIDNIEKLSRRHVIIEKYVTHEHYSLTSKVVNVSKYKFNSFFHFIDFLKENRTRKIFILIYHSWTMEQAENYIKLSGNMDSFYISMAIID